MKTVQGFVTERTYKWLSVITVNAIHGFNHLNSQGVSVLYPVLRDHFAFGYTGIAVLSLIKYGIEGPMQIIYGGLTRVVNRVRIMAIGTVLAFIGVTGMSLSQNYVHLLISRMIRGLGTSPNHTVSGAIMAESFPKARSRAFAMYQTTGTVGSLIAPVLVGSLLYVMGWRLVVFILALPLLVASFVLFSLKEPATDTEAEKKKKRHEKFSISEYKAVFRDRNAILVALVMMVGAAGRGTGSLNTYLATMLVDRFEISPSFAAAFLSSYLFGMLAGPIILGWVADRTSPRLVLAFALVLSAVSVLLILVPQTPGILLFVITFSAGFFIHPRSSLTLSMIVDFMPQDTRVDTLLSVYYTFSSITGPAWLFITGVLVDTSGIATALTVIASSYVAGIVILCLIRTTPVKEASQAHV